MTWPFCAQCGTILTLQDIDSVECDYCGFTASCESLGLGQVSVVTRSKARPPPQWLEELNRGDSAAAEMKRATVEEPCPKCGHPEMSFYTMQLRSADEGQ
eukprot:CAMPEP_0113943950 /NCGR_PEP_ID=MMETSP1339-20121228/29873_1 /TAXON_ID=94617 /ORGANISM="Fibrocapsa japonica" /LENGTH=99 /DNA_ID=CAMNT_0000948967 /DNA_START=35 /DNA_END=331 /DNA_ORIENTATION=- /assembly_acc=CAM_ASM_000762